jgi:predicted nuclease of predicted toxin-antitoxin system
VGAATSTACSVTALLLDEMLSGAIAKQLRARGIDVVAVVEDSALIGTADEDLLAHAAVQQRVLVTVNVADFAGLANDWRAGGRAHAGLVYVTNRTFSQDRSFVGAIASALAALIDADGLPRPGTETFLRRN